MLPVRQAAAGPPPRCLPAALWALLKGQGDADHRSLVDLVAWLGLERAEPASVNGLPRVPPGTVCCQCYRIAGGSYCPGCPLDPGTGAPSACPG
jgi:hypothetical protein